jgi:formylglycine-generating enzyme required for sulfatase activity
LRDHDLLIAAAALADPHTDATTEFAGVARGIVDELKSWLEKDSGRRQEAADALGEMPSQEVQDYLVERSRAEGQPQVALAAILALGRCASRSTLNRRWPQLGPVLCRLHRSLGNPGDESSERILTVLERLGFEWAFVRAGPFGMGEHRSERQDDLGDYWIGKYPVTNAQFARFVDETNHQEKQNWRAAFTPEKERHPVVNVLWQDAMAFCAWAGLVLPSEEQWEKAARGTDGRAYPWGNHWDAARCNNLGTGTTPVDRYPNGLSPYGCYDMAGNTYEWCDSLLDKGTEVRPIRGGSWRLDAWNCGAAGRYWANPRIRSSEHGFRVALVPSASRASPAGPASGARSSSGEAENAELGRPR